jgi:hypothetical protein
MTDTVMFTSLIHECDYHAKTILVRSLLVHKILFNLYNNILYTRYEFSKFKKFNKHKNEKLKMLLMKFPLSRLDQFSKKYNDTCRLVVFSHYMVISCLSIFSCKSNHLENVIWYNLDQFIFFLGTSTI